eukprot:1144759-Pelagomonas_calceolata.AAC.4
MSAQHCAISTQHCVMQSIRSHVHPALRHVHPALHAAVASEVMSTLQMGECRACQCVLRRSYLSVYMDVCTGSAASANVCSVHVWSYCLLYDQQAIRGSNLFAWASRISAHAACTRYLHFPHIHAQGDSNKPLHTEFLSDSEHK